jgi:DNA polymerase
MFVGEGPGRQEHAKGIPFCGESGWELDRTYLPLADLQRPEIFVTNVFRCYRGGDNPTLDQAMACSRRHMLREIREARPEVIVTLGAVASHTLYPGCDLMLEHGLLRPDAQLNPDLGDWRGLHVATYHPAAGIRDSRWMIEIAEAFRRLKAVLDGSHQLLADGYPKPNYRELMERDDVWWELEYCAEPTDEIAVDTEVESLEGMESFCLSFSLLPGTGYVISAQRPDLLVEFADFLGRRLVILHNALFDLPVLAAMGVVIPEGRFVDTMAMAFHQGTPPWGQGLKTLAYRLCGMKMQDFEEVVRPGSLAALRSYFSTCWPTALSGVGPSTQRKVSRLLSDLETGKAEDPWKRIRDWPEDQRREVERAAGGPIPFPSIVHVAHEDAVQYSARDADATLRIYHALRRQAGARLKRLNWASRAPSEAQE